MSRPGNCFYFRVKTTWHKLCQTTLRRMAVNWISLTGSNMLVEVAKPVTLVLCILSLYAVFNAAFLSLSSDLHQRIYESLLRLALATVISVMSGLIFRDATPEPIRAHDEALGHASYQIILLGCGYHARCIRRFLVPGDALHLLPGYSFLMSNPDRIIVRVPASSVFFKPQSNPDGKCG